MKPVKHDSSQQADGGYSPPVNGSQYTASHSKVEVKHITEQSREGVRCKIQKYWQRLIPDILLLQGRNVISWQSQQLCDIVIFRVTETKVSTSQDIVVINLKYKKC
jgi:hypothetical protein